MPVPGLPVMSTAQFTLNITENRQDLDVWKEIGEPIYPVHVNVIVQAGVIVSAVNYLSIAAMDASTLPGGSYCSVTNLGRITGAGGDGGAGARRQAGEDGGAAGGGGGGGGTAQGSGGPGDSNNPTTPGEDANPNGLNGGAGGLGRGAVQVLDPTNPATDGNNGSDAIYAGPIQCDVYNANGELWGGGGGGGGGGLGIIGNNFAGQAGGDGGDAGEDGEDGTPAPSQEQFEEGKGGTAGYALRGQFVNVIKGDEVPNLRGKVGP